MRPSGVVGSNAAKVDAGMGANVDNVVHYCVANMPGAVGRASTYALCNVTLPYALKVARSGLAEATRRDPRLKSAINVHQGSVTNRAVAETFGLDFAADVDAIVR